MLRVFKVRHHHEVTFEVQGHDFMGETLTLRQIENLLKEARVEGAPEDALSFIRNISNRDTSSLTIQWEVSRDPLTTDVSEKKGE